MRRLLATLLLLLGLGASSAGEPVVVYHSPLSICVGGNRAYVVDHTADRVWVVDVAARRVEGSFSVGRAPTRAALSADGRTLYVASLYDHAVDVVDLETRRVTRRVEVGYEPQAVALDGDRLYVANALSDTLSTVEASSGRHISTIEVGHNPRAIAVSPDGTVVVGNSGSRDLTIVKRDGTVETRSLGRANLVRDVACTADGHWAVATHIMAHDKVIPVQMERGWICANGFSVVDLRRPGHYVTLLLDRVLKGAANPWGLALTPDRLYVSLAGAQEIAIVDVPAALRLVAEVKDVKTTAEDVDILEKRRIARRVDCGGNGPRGIALSADGGELLVANYFSGDVSVLDARSGTVRARIPIGPRQEPTVWRQGEIAFNDARVCYQGWMSCASCHQEDATVDGMVWDMPNDGIGNPKNTKSLLDVHDTPPAMWSGMREDMVESVMGGQRFMGFLPKEQYQVPLMTYLGRPPVAPNPFRDVDPEKLRRGSAAFEKARCHVCHPSPTFSDLRKHDLIETPVAEVYVRIDTPSLRGCYRTAPYLHDGRARTLEDIFVLHDKRRNHGQIDALSKDEFSDLMAYLRSL